MTDRLATRRSDREVTEIADGVFAFLQHDGGWCLNNAGIVTAGGAAGTSDDDAPVLVVDTAATEARSLDLLARVRARTAPGTRRFVVNTHSHGDHTFGNHIVATSAAEIIGQEQVVTEMTGAGLGLTGLWPDVPWGAVRVTPPGRTFDRRMSLMIGERLVELLHFGPAHTTADAVVWLPGERVLFAGDVVMSGRSPFVVFGSVAGNLRTIEQMRALQPEVIVPGHGLPGGVELLDTARAYLLWLQRLARDAVSRQLDPGTAAEQAMGTDFGWLAEPERLVANMYRAVAEENGLLPGAPIDALGAFHDMVRRYGLPVCRA